VRLHPSRNLLSNGSFEALADGRPLSWETTGGAAPYDAVAGEGVHGSHAVLVDTPGADASTGLGLRQMVPATVQCTYELHGWLKVVEGRGGRVALGWAALDHRQHLLAQGETVLAGEQGRWTGLGVTFQPPPGTAWLVITAPLVYGGARLLADAFSLEVAHGPQRPVSGPAVDGLLVREAGSNWACLAWTPLPGEFQVRYRAHAARTWAVCPAEADAHCTLLGLTPDADYECLVELAPVPYYDGGGQSGIAPWRRRTSRPLTLHTLPWQPRAWNQLRLWPTQPLGVFAGAQSFPGIEAHDGALCVIECVGGAIHLSRVHPDDLRLEWSREAIAPPPPPLVLAGCVDSCVLGDRLYLTYNLQRSDSKGDPLADARQWLAVYDLAQGRLLGEAAELRPARPGASTYGAGLAVVAQRVWVTWLETWVEAGKRRSRALLASADDLGSGSQPVAWEEGPPGLFWGPALGAFEGQPLLLGSDLAPTTGAPDVEPLVCVRVNGNQFRGLQTLSSLGRNQFPRGVQVGDTFYMVHRTDVAYPTHRGMYQDLMLTALGARGMAVTATPYVADMTFNTWPDIAALGDTLYVVHQKLSHVYGDPDHPARAYGTYIGRIETGPVAAPVPPVR
jgi:hypothetical protein